MLRPSIENVLLRTLSPEDFALLEPDLEAVSFKLRERLIEQSRPLAHIWFPETAVVSIVASTPTGRRSEIALTGREGVIELGSVNGAELSPLEACVQIAGKGWRLPVPALRTAMTRSAGLQAALLRSSQFFLIQVSHTAVVNSAHTIHQRLARWLLMTLDRIKGDTITMTHQLLSMVLGVRRAGVTNTVQKLEDSGAIQARRGHVIITDRTRLELIAADAYGQPEIEYERIFGFDFRREMSLPRVNGR